MANATAEFKYLDESYKLSVSDSDLKPCVVTFPIGLATFIHGSSWNDVGGATWIGDIPANSEHLHLSMRKKGDERLVSALPNATDFARLLIITDSRHDFLTFDLVVPEGAKLNQEFFGFPRIQGLSILFIDHSGVGAIEKKETN